MKERACGGCVLCCYLAFAGKPHGVLCQFAKPGVGCTIYDSRPVICRDFCCSWLAGVTAIRPDELGVMVLANETGELHVFHQLESGPITDVARNELKVAAEHLFDLDGIDSLVVHLVELRPGGDTSAEVLEYGR